MTTPLLFYEHNCEYCGKLVVILSHSDWTYKRIKRAKRPCVCDKTVYYCSYSCFRKDEK